MKAIDPRSAAAAFDLVFSRGDLLEAPVKHTVPRRALWFPVHLGLSKNELEAFTGVLRDRAYDRFIVTMVERSTDEGDVQDWTLATEAAAEYLTLDLPVGNALLAPEGQWGVLFSAAGHAVVGGDDAFVDQLNSALGREPSREIKAFVGHWQELERRVGPVAPWVPHLVNHVCCDALPR